MKQQIFLGGSCNPTTWRREIAIPRLRQAGVAFHNPQVTEWREELVAIEARAKQESELLLFVIDRQTRAIASMLEATEYISAGREVLLVVEPLPRGTEIDGRPIAGRERKDLNRARTYLLELAGRHPRASVFPSVEAAVEFAVLRLRAPELLPA